MIEKEESEHSKTKDQKISKRKKNLNALTQAHYDIHSEFDVRLNNRFERQN